MLGVGHLADVNKHLDLDVLVLRGRTRARDRHVLHCRRVPVSGFGFRLQGVGTGSSVPVRPGRANLVGPGFIATCVTDAGYLFRVSTVYAGYLQRERPRRLPTLMNSVHILI